MVLQAHETDWVADNWAALGQLVEPHEGMLLIETHKAGPPVCFELALTQNYDSLDTILSHFSKSGVFFFLTGCLVEEMKQFISVTFSRLQR